MIHYKELKVRTDKQLSFHDITADIRGAVREAGVQEGNVLVFIPHTTAGVTINENADPDVVLDMIDIIKGLVPRVGNYRHLEGNTAAHMMSSLMGSSVNIIIHLGRPVLGTWQGVYLAEFDGPRERKILIQVRGE